MPFAFGVSKSEMPWNDSAVLLMFWDTKESSPYVLFFALKAGDSNMITVHINIHSNISLKSLKQSSQIQ